MCLHNFDIQCINTILFTLHTMKKLYLYQYIKILLVCLSVCLSVTDVGVAVTNLRVVCKIITCDLAVTEIFSRCKSCCWSGHSELQATRRMPLWTLAIALTTGKNIRLFGVLDQNKIFYLRVTACRE